MNGFVDSAMWLFVAVVNTANLWLTIRAHRRYDALRQQLAVVETELDLHRRLFDAQRLPNGVMRR